MRTGFTGELVPGLVIAMALGLGMGWILQPGTVPEPVRITILVGSPLALFAAWVYWRVLNRLKKLYLKFQNYFGQKWDWNRQQLPKDALTGVEVAFEELSTRVDKELMRLRELESYQRKFIADVSHELRTPIFSIQGYVETLLDGALEDKNVNRKFLKQTQKNVERLSQLVNDLLILSQLESGDLRMNPENFRLYELILDVFELLEPKRTVKDRQVELIAEANGMEQQLVYADRNRVKQVLINLIENGIKYGKPEGTVRVQLTGTNGKVTIRVVDNGPGIEKEHLVHIFERFYRVDKSRSRENGGTGLGLSIVKNLVEAHGESITVDSELGRGTQFEFKLTKAR